MKQFGFIIILYFPVLGISNSLPSVDRIFELIPNFLVKLPVDPWGRPYIYKNIGLLNWYIAIPILMLTLPLILTYYTVKIIVIKLLGSTLKDNARTNIHRPG